MRRKTNVWALFFSFSFGQFFTNLQSHCLSSYCFFLHCKMALTLHFFNTAWLTQYLHTCWQIKQFNTMCSWKPPQCRKFVALPYWLLQHYMPSHFPSLDGVKYIALYRVLFCICERFTCMCQIQWGSPISYSLLLNKDNKWANEHQLMSLNNINKEVEIQI